MIQYTVGETPTENKRDGFRVNLRDDGKIYIRYGRGTKNDFAICYWYGLFYFDSEVDRAIWRNIAVLPNEPKNEFTDEQLEKYIRDIFKVLFAELASKL